MAIDRRTFVGAASAALSGAALSVSSATEGAKRDGSYRRVATEEAFDVQRYGIVPNTPGAAAANTTALKALLDPAMPGPVGRLVFSPFLGHDTYYFDDIIPVRDGIHMELFGCTINFTKVAHTASDDKMGFFTFLRDVSISNGTIAVNYNGTGGVNAGLAIRAGGRHDYGFPGLGASFVDEDTLTVPMGNIRLQNLRITTNNPATAVVLLLGGLRGVVLDTIEVDGQGAPADGICYEFGDWHYSATAASHKTAHASEMVFRNITVKNLNSAIAGGAGLGLTGCYAALVENLHVDGANVGFSFRPGEALFYNVGTPDIGLVTRCMTLRNISCKNVDSGLNLIGAESKASGYLAGEPLTEAQQTDLMQFSFDGPRRLCDRSRATRFRPLRYSQRGR